MGKGRGEQGAQQFLLYFTICVEQENKDTGIYQHMPGQSQEGHT